MRHAIRTGFFPVLVAALAALIAGGCAGEPRIERIDLTGVAGGLVVAYDGRDEVRTALEDQLVADLTGRGLVAFASHADLADILGRSPDEVIHAANARRAAAVLVVREVRPSGAPDEGGAPAPTRPESPDLPTYLARVRSEAPETVAPGPPASQEALVEVNLFLLQGAQAQRFWSGVAITGAADGSGAGLRDLSGQIAEALARAQRELRGN